MNSSFLKRNISDAIKGVALVMMFVYHFFTWPDWYVSSVSYPSLAVFARYLNAPMMLCVPVFAFLSGYFYHFSTTKTLGYSLRKATDLLIAHGIACAIMIPLAVFLGGYRVSLSGIALELFGFQDVVMTFNWYVQFYCVSMLLLPVIVRASTGKLSGDVFVLLVLPVVAVEFLRITIEEHIPVNLDIVNIVLRDLRQWFPCVISGYLFARYSLFETYFDDISDKISGKIGQMLFWLCLCGIGFVGRLAMPRFSLGHIQPSGVWQEIVFSMDILYAPLFIYGIARLLAQIRIGGVITCLAKVGQRSMYMWFLHAIFFNPCKEVTQPLIYTPRNPVLVLVLALSLCYLCAVVLTKISKPLSAFKNKLFAK